MLKNYLIIYAVVIFFTGTVVFAETSPSIVEKVKETLGITPKRVEFLPVFDVKEFEKVVGDSKYSPLDKIRADRKYNVDFLKAMIATTTNEKI